jgi:hypothetical protein
MSIADHKELSRRLYAEVFGAGNVAAADEILAPECLSHAPGMAPRVGSDGIKNAGGALAWGNPRPEGNARGSDRRRRPSCEPMDRFRHSRRRATATFRARAADRAADRICGDTHRPFRGRPNRRVLVHPRPDDAVAATRDPPVARTCRPPRERRFVSSYPRRRGLDRLSECRDRIR